MCVSQQWWPWSASPPCSSSSSLSGCAGESNTSTGGRLPLCGWRADTQTRVTLHTIKYQANRMCESEYLFMGTTHFPVSCSIFSVSHSKDIKIKIIINVKGSKKVRIWSYSYNEMWAAIHQWKRKAKIHLLLSSPSFTGVCHATRAVYGLWLQRFAHSSVTAKCSFSQKC